MGARRWLCTSLLLLSAAPAASQSTTTYHLHNEISALDGNKRQLSPAAPDAAAVTLSSTNLKGSSSNWVLTVEDFETQAGVPSGSGVVPAGTVVTFSLWLRKTANYGELYPAVNLFRNNYAGPGSAYICGLAYTTAPGQITTTLQLFTLTCTTSSAVPMTPSDRFYVQAGAWVAQTPGNHNLQVEVRIEGTLEGNYDSRISIPNIVPVPTISTLDPSSGPVNWPVTITGSGFGTQGTVTFNGIGATPTSFNNTTIVAPVPSGASTGPVVVTTAGGASNGVPFTVVGPPSIVSVTPNAARRGDSVTISGTNFLPTQASSTVTFNGVAGSPTTWGNMAIVVPVPPTATSGPLVVTVANQASNSLPFTVNIPGALSGAVTRTSDGSPLGGATVQAVLAGVVKQSATTAGDGTYSLLDLDPGDYNLRVHATGFSSDVRRATVIPEQTTSVNVAMSQPGSISGKVTQADGTTPIAGASVTLFMGGIEKGTTVTNATGDYSIAGLHPGAYTVQAAYVGYRTKEQGATILENASATADLMLSPMPAGPVTYAYDELGRLIMVVDAAEDAATYEYDAVGNILSIGRIGAGTVAITEFTPNAATVGSPVTIFGTGFSATPSENSVTFNGVPAAVTSSTTTRIAVTVPAGATTGPIGVSTPAGSATSAVNFIVAAPSGSPSISGFSPSIAASGATLTIDGANFEITPADNRLTLNVTFANVETATANTLTTTIPVTVTSGKVAVATTKGTAVSAGDLFIAPPGFAAADVEFTGRLGFGEGAGVTVPITVSGKIGLAVFDGAAGQEISMRVTGSTIAGATLKIFRPNGSQFLSTSFGTSGLFIDRTTLTQGGTYTVLVDPSGTNVGTATLTLYDVAPVTGTINPDGVAVVVTTTAPGQNARLTFSGTAGRYVSLQESAGSYSSGADVYIKNPDGTTLASNFVTTSAFIDAQRLPASGTYTILVDPRSTATGSVTLRLYDVTPVTGTIVPGGPPVLVTTTVPGQNAELAFSGSAGQRVSLRETGASFGFSGADVYIKNPDGTTLASNFVLSDAFLDRQTLAATGTYTILVDPRSGGTGSVTLTLYDVPVDFTGTIAADGNPVVATTTVPGQNAQLTFSGTAGQRISLNATGASFGSSGADIFMTNPDGSTLASTFVLSSAFIDTQVLPGTGTYTIRIDPRSGGFGSLTLRLYDVPPDSTGSLTVNGGDALFSNSAPGQNGSFTFSGTSGQQVTVRVTDNSFTSSPCVTIRLFRQDGTTQLTSSLSCSATFDLTPQTLPASETYTVRIDPGGAQVGSLRGSVTSP